MPYNLPKADLFKPVSQWGGGSNSSSAMAGSAAKAGLGLLTGGSSDIISQVLNIIPSIFQGVVGGRQLKQAKDIEANNPRPTATIAPSVQKMTDYAYGQTMNQDIPGGEMYRNEIKGATAAGMRAASDLGSGAEAYGMLGQLVGREQNAFGDLAKQTAQQVAGYKGQYMDALGVKANEENRVWNWNEADPYLRAAQVAQQLRDSGMRNVNSGIKNVFGSSAEALASKGRDFNSSLAFGRGTTGLPQQYTMDDIAQWVNKMKANQ